MECNSVENTNRSVNVVLIIMLSDCVFDVIDFQEKLKQTVI